MVPLRDGIAIDAGLRVKRRRLVDHPWRRKLEIDAAPNSQSIRGLSLPKLAARSLRPVRSLPWQPAKRSKKLPPRARELARTMSAPPLPGTSGPAA
jgi:hypothetical protein